MGRASLALLWMLTACGDPDFATGAGPADETANTCGEVGGVPAEVRAELDLDAHYTRYCAVYGIPVLGSEQVPDSTLQTTAALAAGVFADRLDVRDAVHDRYFRIVVVASSAGEQLTDVPELADLDPVEAAAAGIGPLPEYPAASIRDSVILCRPPWLDPLVTPPGDTLVHELGHAVLSMGLNAIDPSFDGRLQAAYRRARDANTWSLKIPGDVAAAFGALQTDNYLMSNAEEYWAVAVSAWFGFKAIPTGYALSDALGPSGEPQLTIEALSGRHSLQKRDPELVALLEEAFPSGLSIDHHCPGWEGGAPDP